MRRLVTRLAGYRSAAVCVAATSATLLLATRSGVPLGPALMYNDRRARRAAARIAAVAPPTSAVQGATSSLAKALRLSTTWAAGAEEVLALHQADWIMGCLSGRFGLCDWNNALKLGFDPVSERWPDWLDGLDLGRLRLPVVVAPGTPVGKIAAAAAAETGLAPETAVVAGTTDSTAAVIAAGATEPGEAVTCLGSTLVVKVVTESPIVDPRHGVYSHRLGDKWLAGGASNSGGAVLRRFFDEADILRLSGQIRPEEPTGLDYYPLPCRGERFPIHDPELPPRLTPRPADDARFFQGLLEGVGLIEAAGYRLLCGLGALPPARVITIGGRWREQLGLDADT